MSPLFAIIVAGGRGLRMGRDIPKQFLQLDNKPVLMHTLERFHQYNSNLKLILVLPKDQFGYWQTLCKKHSFTIPLQLVEGGQTRFHSVRNGLSVINEGVVAIHDGVRPFVSHETIARCFHAACNYGSAIPVTNMIESLRVITGVKSQALQRDSYRAVQTPQVFKTDIIKSAYKQPYNHSFTDDASVAEAAGYEITLVEGNRENIKITSPFDLLVAHSILEQQKG